MISSCVSQVTVQTGKTGPLGVALAQKQDTGHGQQQDRRSKTKQLFIMFRYLFSNIINASHGETYFRSGAQPSPT